MHPRRLLHPLIALRRRQLLPQWVRRVDAAAARAINTGHAHPRVDRGYARLSTAANYSRLWFTIAGVLALTGGHRPALRGIASLTVASVLANLVGKQLFGGDRPLLKDVPVGRHLSRTPTSGSFPSGHSASAVGFATGVALESPRLGLAIAPLAFGVAYSRMHVGAHWLSDVVGGASLGVGVAALGKLVVPVNQPVVVPVRNRAALVELPPHTDGSHIFIISNPSAGAGLFQSDPLPIIAERLPGVTVHLLRQGESIASIVHGAEGSEVGPHVLGACGGDGTVSGVAHLAREANLPLLVIPGGTFNHFARTAGLDTVDRAIDALAAGHGVKVDVAELTMGDGDPVTVVNTASVGIYPDFVREREQREPRLGKWFAAVVAAVRVLRRADPVDVTINGRDARVWSLFVGVNRNYPATVAPLQRRRLDDGVLDVRILHAGSRAHAVASLAFGRKTSAVLRRLRLIPAASLESFTADAVEVRVRPRHGQPPGFAHDGEYASPPPEGEMPAGGYVSRLRILPQGLTIYSPR